MKKTFSFLMAAAVVLSLAQPCREGSNVMAAPKGIRLNVKKKTLQKGKTFVIKCKGTTKKVRWTVSNKKIVTVIKKGKNSIRIKGKSCGKTTITAKVGKKKKKCVIVVQNKKNTTETTKTKPATTSTTEQTQNTQPDAETPTLPSNEKTTEIGTTEESATEKITTEKVTTEKPATEVSTEKITTEEATTEKTTELSVHAVPYTGATERTEKDYAHRDNEAQIDVESSFTFPTYTGDGTFYGGGYTGGCCCLDSETNGYYVCAMNRPQYNIGQLAGTYIEITGPLGTVKALVSDELPEGKWGDIDMNEELFPLVAKVEDGRVPISWKIVPFPTDEPIKYWIKKDSTRYWMQIQIRNQRYPIAKLELQQPDGTFIEVPKRNYNFFEIGPSGIGEPGDGPYVFRVTDINGQVLVDTIPLMPGYVIDGKENFPY